MIRWLKKLLRPFRYSHTTKISIHNDHVLYQEDGEVVYDGLYANMSDDLRRRLKINDETIKKSIDRAWANAEKEWKTAEEAAKRYM